VQALSAPLTDPTLYWEPKKANGDRLFESHHRNVRLYFGNTPNKGENGHRRWDCSNDKSSQKVGQLDKLEE
jgi:hypothetical protein